MNKFNLKVLKSVVVSLFLVLTLCGCASLTYSGEDCNTDLISNVRTDEDFYFNTYQKSLGDVDIKMGISKTTIPEILVLYVQVLNKSYDSNFTFSVDDLKLSNSRQEVPFITGNNYLTIWQNQEISSMSAMSAMSSTLTNMTGMSANYNDFNQSMLQNSNEQSNKSAISSIEQMGNKILAHSVKTSSTVSPRKSQYYYFFFEDLDEFPIFVNYKNLSYQFTL